MGLAVIASRLLASMLPETARFDASVAAVAVVLLAATAVVAAAIPASRVLRLNPLAILRHS
jgi:ABC-type antimicrobial peptide transport system permease subunit